MHLVFQGFPVYFSLPTTTRKKRLQTTSFRLNDRRIPIQYPSCSAKGFGEAIELLIAGWVKLLDSGIWPFVLTHYASWPT